MFTYTGWSSRIRYNGKIVESDSACICRFRFGSRGPTPNIIAGRLNTSVGVSRPSSVRCLRAGDHGGSTAGQRGSRGSHVSATDFGSVCPPVRLTPDRFASHDTRSSSSLVANSKRSVRSVDANRSPLFPSVPSSTQSDGASDPRLERRYRSDFGRLEHRYHSITRPKRTATDGTGSISPGSPLVIESCPGYPGGTTPERPRLDPWRLLTADISSGAIDHGLRRRSHSRTLSRPLRCRSAPVTDVLRGRNGVYGSHNNTPSRGTVAYP